MVGRAMALRIRGCTSEGPGPMSVRTGGIKEVTVITLPVVNIKETVDLHKSSLTQLPLDSEPRSIVFYIRSKQLQKTLARVRDYTLPITRPNA